MSEIYREDELAILHQVTAFKVMADARAKDWTPELVKQWVSDALVKTGKHYAIEYVIETGSIAPLEWRWFVVFAEQYAPDDSRGR